MTSDILIEMATACTRCGADHTPSHDAYLAGTWRICTRCRGDPGEEASGAVDGESERAQGHTALRYGQVEEKDVNSD
jgi:hypothetical protein